MQVVTAPAEVMAMLEAEPGASLPRPTMSGSCNAQRVSTDSDASTVPFITAPSVEPALTLAPAT